MTEQTNIKIRDPVNYSKIIYLDYCDMLLLALYIHVCAALASQLCVYICPVIVCVLHCVFLHAFP